MPLHLDRDMSHASVLCIVSHISFCSISFFLFSCNLLCNLSLRAWCFYVFLFLLSLLYLSVLCCCTLCVCGWGGGGLIRWREKTPWPVEGLWFRHHSGPVPAVSSGVWPGPRGLWHLLLHRGVRRSLLWVGTWLMESWRDGLWTLSRVLDRIIAVPE